MMEELTDRRHNKTCKITTQQRREHVSAKKKK